MSTETYDRMQEAIAAHLADVYDQPVALLEEWVMVARITSPDEEPDGYAVETSHHGISACYGLAALAVKQLHAQLPTWDPEDDDG